MKELINESDLREFIHRLPEISYDPLSVHLVMLATRSRFAELKLNMKIKDLVVERKIIKPTSQWREFYFNKVHNLAALAQHGLYEVKDTRITPECFGIYATIVPRNVSTAIGNILNEVNKQLLAIMNQDVTATIAEEDKERFLSQKIYLSKLDTKFFGRLHAHKRSKLFRAVSLDVDEPSIFREVRDMVSSFDVWMVTQTSRGYHIILDLHDRVTGQEFYAPQGAWDSILQKFGRPKKESQLIEIQRDPQEPIPGTLYYRPNDDTLNYVTIIE